MMMSCSSIIARLMQLFVSHKLCGHCLGFHRNSFGLSQHPDSWNSVRSIDSFTASFAHKICVCFQTILANRKYLCLHDLLQPASSWLLIPFRWLISTSETVTTFVTWLVQTQLIIFSSFLLAAIILHIIVFCANLPAYFNFLQLKIDYFFGSVTAQ